MEKLTELVTFIAKSLVDSPEKVEVREVSGEQTAVLELKVAPRGPGENYRETGKDSKSDQDDPGRCRCQNEKKGSTGNPRVIFTRQSIWGLSAIREDYQSPRFIRRSKILPFSRRSESLNSIRKNLHRDGPGQEPEGFYLKECRLDKGSAIIKLEGDRDDRRSRKLIGTQCIHRQVGAARSSRKTNFTGSS